MNQAQKASQLLAVFVSLFAFVFVLFLSHAALALVQGKIGSWGVVYFLWQSF